MSEEKQPRKASSVRHTRAIQRDRAKHSIPAPSDEQIQERLTEIVHPATLAQVDPKNAIKYRSIKGMLSASLFIKYYSIELDNIQT